MNDTVTIKNAIIKSATITTHDRGFLDCWLDLDYGGSGQGFGGFVLYLPESFDHHRLMSPAGHFIYRVMEIAGVESWKELEGKPIRVKSSFSHIDAIGHILNDDWFNPESELKAREEI